MPREYAWAKRHTVESWKERYKKMAEIFDPLIEEIARKEKTLEKQLWREDRRVSGKKRREVEEEGEEDDDDGEEGKNKEEEEEEENEEGDVIEIMEEAQEEMEDDMDREWVGQELFEPGQWENDEDTQGSHEQESFEENALDEQRAVVDSSDRTKRRKSEHNPTAAKTVKRKRSEQDNDSPVQQARNKGKRRSYEQEKGDEEVHNTYAAFFAIADRPLTLIRNFFSNGNDGVPFEEFEYFDVDEPGPSNTLRSPDRTLPEPLSSSRMAHTTSLTQETLVNPTNSHQMEAFEPLSQSTSANRRHSGNTTQSRFLSREVREQSPVISPSPSPHPPAQHSGNMVFEIDPTSGMVIDVLQPPPTLEAANPQIAARSPTQVRRGPKPRPVGKQLLSTARAGYDPPYRNTRSRFRSVEPVAFREPKPRLKTKKKKEVIPEEVKVEEVPLEIPRDSAPVTETIKEEMDVENLLKVDESNQSMQAPARELSLETDDAQTRQDLHSALRAGPLAGITFMSNRVKASDVLRKYAESTGSSRRFSVPPAQRPVVPLDSKNTRPRHTEPQGGRPRQHITNITTGTSGAGFKDLEPRTTVQVPHLRGSSMSSTEPFPLRGTRARAKKRERQEIEKHSPYKPPQGSRAAQFAGSR